MYDWKTQGSRTQNSMCTCVRVCVCGCVFVFVYIDRPSVSIASCNESGCVSRIINDSLIVTRTNYVLFHLFMSRFIKIVRKYIRVERFKTRPESGDHGPKIVWCSAKRHRPVSMDERVGKIRRYPRFPPVIVSRSALGIFFFSLLSLPFLFFSSHALVCMRPRAPFRFVLSFSFGEFLPDSRKLRAVSILPWFVREYFVTPGIFRACIYAALSVNADFRICISFPIANRGIKRDRRK